MDDLVKLLTDTKLDMLPNCAADLEDIIDREKNYLVGAVSTLVIRSQSYLETMNPSWALPDLKQRCYLCLHCANILYLMKLQTMVHLSNYTIILVKCLE